MRIRKFRGKSVDSVMRRIKREVGPDAELLETGSVREPGIMGYFRPRQVEMTVVFEDRVERAGPPGGDEEPAEEPASAARGGGDPELTRQLVGRGVPEELAPVLARVSRSAGEVAWMRTVPIRPPRAGGQKVIALVGPTGAGKTTTCAKLAARMALGEGVRVGLLTQDTYRIGAVEQLRKYARILEMDLEVVFTPGEMGPALRRLGDSQVVLIDTAGHNPRDRRWMQRLREFLAAAAADEVHLVLSAATATEDARAVMAHYRKVAYNRLLLTKIDETDRPGRAVALARDAGVPLSYVCTGQEVPDDIGPASDVLSGLLLRGVV